MPSHFWYLLAFTAYMLRVVFADSDLFILTRFLFQITFSNQNFVSTKIFRHNNEQLANGLIVNVKLISKRTLNILFVAISFYFFSEFWWLLVCLIENTTLLGAAKTFFGNRKFRDFRLSISSRNRLELPLYFNSRYLNQFSFLIFLHLNF